ncbi:hypothetical protein GGH13_004347 [Coemansia sp. S155-1]|nr:hypothetical protein GGH13_004347 [Coemansia sp. S155-1]KAJ2432216.1 hypothetical protein GGF41_000105 [Coemansia sp. RSA 2531]
MQGAILTKEDITSIQAPLIAMVKHKFRVPSTTPLSFWFTWAGGRLPRLHAEYERRAVDMTVQFCNGNRSSECSNLAKRMAQYAQKQLNFPGDLLAYPELAATVRTVSAKLSWWTNMSHVLVRQGINICKPAYGNVEDNSILAVLRPGWAGKEDAQAYQQMYE